MDNVHILNALYHTLKKEKKGNPLNLRLTESERIVLTNAANKENLNLSDAIRVFSLREAMRVINIHPFVK